MLFDDGLDTVELVMLVEDLLEHSISDQDAEKMQTVGDLCDYLYEVFKTAHRGDDTLCLSAAAFYAARRTISLGYGLDPRDLRPESAVESLLATTARKKAWRQLGERLGVRLPRLEFPKLLAWTPFFIMAICLMIGFLLRSDLVVIVGVAAFIPVLLAFGLSEYFFGNQLPAQYRTLGQLSVLLMPGVLRGKKGPPANWSRGDIYQIVRSATARCAGVSPSHIKPETSFVRDLH